MSNRSFPFFSAGVTHTAHKSPSSAPYDIDIGPIMLVSALFQLRGSC